MIGQTFTLTGSPKLMFRLVWRGSIKGIDGVRGDDLNGKLQTLRRRRHIAAPCSALTAPVLRVARRRWPRSSISARLSKRRKGWR